MLLEENIPILEGLKMQSKDQVQRATERLKEKILQATPVKIAHKNKIMEDKI